MAYKWSAKFDPDEVKDYVVNWSAILDGDVINGSTWEIPSEAVGLTKDSDTYNDTTTTIWLSVTSPDTNRATLAGNTYGLLNTITTIGGRTLQRTIKLGIKEL
jgi:hypothetical protein